MNVLLISGVLQFSLSLQGCSSGGDGDGTEDQDDVDDDAAEAGSDDQTPPTALLNLPSFDASGGTAISFTFSEAINPDTINGETVTVTDDDGEVICGGESGTVTYDEETQVATCEGGFEGCDDLQGYQATLSSGVEDLAGNSLVPASFSFTTADDAFENSGTDQGEDRCWMEVGNDNDSIAVIDIDGANDGKWSFRSTGVATADGVAMVYIKPLSGDFSLLVKLDTLSFGNTSAAAAQDNQFSLGLFSQQDESEEEASPNVALIDFPSVVDPTLRPLSVVDGNLTVGTEASLCDECLSTNPGYFCLRRTGDAIIGSYSEDGDTFQGIDFGVSDWNLGPDVNVGFQFQDPEADPGVIATADFIRFSTDSSSCPSAFFNQ